MWMVGQDFRVFGPCESMSNDKEFLAIFELQTQILDDLVRSEQKMLKRISFLEKTVLINGIVIIILGISIVLGDIKW
jgi:hypothetical protein